MVELSHVTVSYGEKHALNDISLKVNDGEFTFISGDNGAGKSTLIKLLIGDVKADKIDGVDTVVKVNGHDLTTINQRGIPELRRTIGFIFQDFKLIDSMNVFDNVAFVLRSIDASTRYIKKRVPQVIGLMGLQSKVKQYPSELS
ncbi:MAG: ATP-binding cassette domain-containing protein, partial [Oscillospiraceae bacterium]|nr:ATP-binding cassette domain-containing protein [Oscillospiraceae bacterium]